MELPTFITDVLPTENVDWKSGISQSNTVMILDILEHFFVKAPFLKYIGDLMPAFKHTTWKDLDITHLHVAGVSDDDNTSFISISYYNDEFHKAVYDEYAHYSDTHRINRNHVEDYFMSVTGRRTIKQKVQYDRFQHDLNFTEPKVIDHRDWPINRARADQIFGHVIAIWVEDITASHLEAAMTGPEADFMRLFDQAVSDGFHPDSKFISKMLAAKLSFEAVCHASKWSNGLTLEQIMRGIPIVINEKHHTISRKELETREEFHEWESKFEVFHEHIRMLHFNYETIIRPWWYDRTWTLLNDRLSEIKRDVKKMKGKARQARWDALMKKSDKRLSRPEQILRDASPKCGEFQVEDLRTTASYKAIESAIRRNELNVTRELLFFAMNMGPFEYHHRETLELMWLSSGITLKSEDIDHMIDVVKPEKIAFEWIFGHIKPTRKQVERYVESLPQNCDPLHDQNIIHFLQNCSEPYSNKDLSDFFVSFDVSPCGDLYRELKYTITDRHFKFILKDKRHHHGLWRMIVFDNLSQIKSGRGDERSFEPHASLKATSDDVLTLLNFNCKIRQKDKCDVKSDIIGFLFRTNPEMEVTRDHVKMAIRNNYRPVTVFFLMRRLKEPITIKELCEYVGYINRDESNKKNEISYHIEELAKTREQMIAWLDNHNKNCYSGRQKKPEYLLKVV